MTAFPARRYAVMSDSHKTPGMVMARRPAGQAGWKAAKGFWTDTDPTSVGCFIYEDATEIVAKLGMNQPRVVRFEKAVAAIARQKHPNTAHGALAAAAETRAIVEAVMPQTEAAA